MRIDSKQRFYDLFTRGFLGNATRSWGYAEYLEYHRTAGTAQPATVAVRYKMPNWPHMRYDLTPSQALRYMDYCASHHGARYDLYNISEHAPDHLITLQGEVTRTERGLYLICAIDQKGRRMRDVMADASVLTEHTGMMAWGLLRHYMDDHSFQFFRELIDGAPDDRVIELACYECRFGTHHWNTAFWEVRDGY